MYFQAATIPSSIANAIENVAKIHKTAIKTIFIFLLPYKTPKRECGLFPPSIFFAPYGVTY